jgi:hypothetical protein
MAPASAPNNIEGRSRKGSSRLIGLPFFVTTTGSPLSATSSITWRHFALNSDAFISFMPTSSVDMTMVLTMIISWVTRCLSRTSGCERAAQGCGLGEELARGLESLRR